MSGDAWRSMFDDPPPHGVAVLAWNIISNRDGSTTSRVITATVTGNGFLMAGDKSRGRITHWMPLPAPPTDAK